MRKVVYASVLIMLAGFVPPSRAQAGVPLSPAQLQALKADIAADPSLAALPNTGENDFTIAAAYNLTATPDFWVWRTAVREAEYTASPSPDGTLWSWPAYIARSVGEQNAWGRMFMGNASVNPSLPNIQQGFADIFSGTQNSAPAQRTHLMACSRRKATRAEKVFAVGTGSTAAPATMGYEGAIDYTIVLTARSLP